MLRARRAVAVVTADDVGPLDEPIRGAIAGGFLEIVVGFSR